MALNLSRFGEIRLYGQTGGVENAKVFALLPRSRLLASSESFLFLKQRFIVGSRLIVITSDIGQLLFSHRLAIQSSLVFRDFPFSSSMARSRFAISIRLTFNWLSSSAMGDISLISASLLEPVVDDSSGRTIRRFGFQIFRNLLLHLLSFGNLLFYFTNVRVTIRVMRAKVGQPGLQPFQFLLERGQPHGGVVADLVDL